MRPLLCLLVAGMAVLCVAEAVDDDMDSLLQETMERERDEFIFGDKRKVPTKVPHTKGKAHGISKYDMQCAICKYLVERIKGEMLMNGVHGGIPFGNSPPLVGVPRFTAGGVTSKVNNPATMFTPPVAGAKEPAAGGAPPAAGSAGAEPPASLLEVDAQRARTGFIGKAFRKGRSLFKRFSGKLNHYAGGGMHLPVRDRTLALRHWRPAQIRYANMYDGPARAARRAQERWENQQMQNKVYSVLENICAKHMPKPFWKWCFGVIKKYERVAEGLRWGDRPALVCIHIGACTQSSYVRQGPHEVLKNFS